MNILCIEDEASTLEIYKRFLSDAGYNVVSARNGQEGIDAFARNNESNSAHDFFDVVVVDFRMPVSDGVETINAILATKPDQKIILATAYPYEVTEKARDIPKDRVRLIRKPFDPDDLLKLIRDYQDQGDSIE